MHINSSFDALNDFDNFRSDSAAFLFIIMSVEYLIDLKLLDN